MPPRISAFPKCYLDDIAGARTMSVLEWIEVAEGLDADALEMYEGFFTSLDPDHLDQVGEAISRAGFAMPMLCCSNGASVGVQTDTGATFVASMSGIAHPPLNDVWTIPGEEHKLAEFEALDHQRFQEIDATTHCHALQLQDFLRAVLEDRPPLVTGAEGRIVVEMFTAIYRSNELRRPIRFPL